MLDRTLHRSDGMTDEAMSRVEGGEPTVQLVREALDETRELVRLEVALAREELKGELTRAKAGAIALGTAGGLGVSAFTMFVVAVAVAFALSWLAALVLGALLLMTAGAIGYAGYKAMPRKPLGETKGRIRSDLDKLKERIA
jgi:hypothetical protein